MKDYTMGIFYACVVWIFGWAASFGSIYGFNHVVALWEYAIMFAPLFTFTVWQAMPLGDGDDQ